jgi:hypothetical protein
MCELCELSYQYNVKENHDLISDSYCESIGWKRTHIRVQDGTSITNNEYLIVVNDKNIILCDKNYNEIDYIEHCNIITDNLNIFKNRVKIGYYKNFKEIAADSKAKVPVKKWTAILDTRTCINCRKLHGQTKQEWALFWININGKIYSLKSPPLHWVFNKAGNRIVTCRCVLERTIIYKKDLPKSGKI